MTPPQGSTGQHLDEMTLLLYLERQLDRERAMEVSSHMQECGDCRTLLRALERESRLLTRAMLEDEEPLPARLASFQQKAKRSMQWIWMVTFGLAATGIYAIYTSYVEPVQTRLQDAGFGGTNLLGLLIFQGAFWKGWQSMLSLVEILAFLVIGVSAALLFRKWFRRGTLAALLVTGMCGALMLPAGAGATEFRKGQDVSVTSGETIKGDIFLNGDRLTVDGTVNGDVFAFGRSLDVNGHVLGDVIVFAKDVHISGQIDGNVRSFANNLTLIGTINRSLTIFCDELNIEKSGKIGRSMTMFSNEVTLGGHVGQDVLAMNQRLDISGQVEGDIQLKAERLTIASTGQVGGAVHYKGVNPPEVSPQAKLASAVDYQHVEKLEQHEGGRYYLHRLLWSASFILYGLVLVLLMPNLAGECVKSAENVGASLGLGVLVFCGAIVAIPLACLTIVGIPLAVLTLMLWLVLVFTAQIVFGGLLGRWILGPAEDTWGRVGRMAMGMAILGVAVPIVHLTSHWIEIFFKLAIMIWGMGALSLTIYKRLQRSSGAVVAPPMVA
jgi:cytoskeletal protein CcmA (bactofilin family)